MQSGRWVARQDLPTPSQLPDLTALLQSCHSGLCTTCVQPSMASRVVEEDAEGSPPSELNTSGNLSFVDVSVAVCVPIGVPCVRG